MNTGIRELIIAHIDEALDIDDLERVSDYLKSILVSEGISEWEMAATLKNLYAELLTDYQEEKDHSRRTKIKTVINSIETDYSGILVAKEVGSVTRFDYN
jgi:hypothetical protein